MPVFAYRAAFQHLGVFAIPLEITASGVYTSNKPNAFNLHRRQKNMSSEQIATSKLEVEIRAPDYQVLYQLRHDLTSVECDESTFAFIPRGGSDLNLEHELLSFVVAYVQAGGVELLRVLVHALASQLNRKKVPYFEVRFQNGGTVRVTSSMSEKTTIKLFKKASKLTFEDN